MGPPNGGFSMKKTLSSSKSYSLIIIVLHPVYYTPYRRVLQRSYRHVPS